MDREARMQETEIKEVYDREAELKLHANIRKALGVELAEIGSLVTSSRTRLKVKVRERAKGDLKVELRSFYGEKDLPGKGILLEPATLEWVILMLGEARKYAQKVEESREPISKISKTDKELRRLRGEGEFPAEIDLKGFMEGGS